MQQLTTFNTKESSVIIGFSARLPASLNLNDFWQLLCEQKNAISQTPAKRLHFMQTHPGSFIDNVDEFDADFFNVSSFEAKVMDPQQRLLLQEVWRALEMAKLDIKGLRGSATGVFVGASNFDYAKLLSRYQIENPYIPFASSPNLLANRISTYFDFCGPSETINTGDVSSLSALDKAVKAINQGEIDQAIVCGVNLLLDDELFYAGAQLGRLSSTRGEGIIVVVLCKESIALAQNNAIYANILTTVVSHFGKSPQADVLQQLNASIYSKVDIKRLSYIETNADKIVLEAWKNFISSQSLNIKIGSVQDNIGHLEAASGLAGCIKILLMFQHKTLPQQIDEPYLAHLSSFDRGGAHAHAVLEQGSGLFADKKCYPFVRKKIWFETKKNDYLYKEETLCIDKEISQQRLNPDGILLIYSPALKASIASLCLESIVLDDFILGRLTQSLQTNSIIKRIIIYLDIPEFYSNLDLFTNPIAAKLSLVFSVLKTITCTTFPKDFMLDVYTYCKQSSNKEHPQIAMISGLLASLNKERPNWQFRHIDTDEALNLKLMETNFTDILQTTYYHQGHFLTKMLAKTANDEEEEFFQQGGVYLILGEMSAITKLLMEFLFTNFKARIILIAKSPVEAKDYDSSFEFIQSDITDELQFNLLIKYLSLKYQSLDAVFDLQLQTNGKRLEFMAFEEFQEEIQARILRIYFIKQLQQSLKLQNLVILSSIESYKAGEGANAAASCGVDAYAKYLEGIRDLKLKLINWSAGQEIEGAWEAMQRGLNSLYSQFAVYKEAATIINNEALPQAQKPMEDFFEVVPL